MKNLSLPQEVLDSDRAVEFLRAWLDEEGEITFLSLGDIWEDSGAIGIFLADLLKHFVQNSSSSESEKRVRALRAAHAFALEMNLPLLEAPPRK